MASEPFSFDLLSKHDAAERKSGKLTKLEPSFWSQAWAYLENLEATYAKAHSADATGKKTILLGDELRNARRKAESLWEARERKITFHAMKTVRQERPDKPANLVAEEQVFYDRFVSLLQKHHAQMFRPREPEPPAPAPEKKGEAAKSSAKETPKAAAPEPAAAEAKPKPEEDIATVRALVDVPPFVGLDARTYRLKKGEIATIPRKMAEILRKNGKVAPVA